MLSESCISRRSLERVFALAFPESNEEFQPQIVFSGPVDAVRRGSLHIHQLALLFAVFATGARFSLENLPDDPLSYEYISCTERCLSSSNILAQPTMMGLQSLASDNCNGKYTADSN